jgi:outer membrane receptor protein involved in Fe transport
MKKWISISSTLTLTLFLAGFGMKAFAQDSGATESNIENFSLDDLMNAAVTSASKVKQKQSEAASIISVIPRENFYDYGWFTLNDALNHQAGFFPSKDYDRNVIGSRGLFEGWNNNHILHLVDGVPFNDPMYGSAYTWDNTPVFMVKSVEVIRGPGSALYGSNATNGVIAVQTLSGDDMKGRAEGRIKYGSYNSTTYEAYTGNTIGNFDFFTGFHSMQSDGWEYASADNSGRTDPSGMPAEFSVQDDRSTQYFMFKAEGKGALKDWSFQYHDQSWRFQTGHGWLWSIPDLADSMYEHRRLLTASYKPQLSANVSSEFTLKYERKEIDWFTHYFPRNASYPQGADEHVNFFHDNYFGRGQLTWDLGNNANFLAGLESNVFVYNGDETHYSNTNFQDPLYGPTAGGEWKEAEPIMGLIKEKPVVNIGVYSQLLTGNWVSSKLPITLGARYDRQMIKYDKRYVQGTEGTEERTFDAFSPRLGIVYLASDRMSFKFLAGRAFRAPSPSELAGTNTWALANDIRNLEPETVTTFELGSDWRVTDSLNWKMNFFHTRFEDQIGYSTSNANLSTNIYTTTNAGAETEVNYVVGRTKSFFNLSYAQRMSEEVRERGITEDDDRITWAPSLTSNLGVTQSLAQKFKVSGVLEYMSAVSRRDSDNLTATNVQMRGSNVDAWYTANVAAHYDIFKDSTLSLFVNNVLNQKGELIKNRDYAFDYKREELNYYLSFSHKL